jgi:hypothetical protein
LAKSKLKIAHIILRAARRWDRRERHGELVSGKQAEQR